MDKKQTLIQIIALCIPCVAILSLGFALHFSPEFKMFQELISELGYFPKGYAATKTGAFIFNYGITLTGLFALLFSILLRLQNKLFSPMACTLLIAMSCSLILLGIIHESASKYHLLYSIIFFTLIPCCLFKTGKDLLRIGKQKFGKINIALGIVCFLLLPFLLIPPLELVPMICIMFFSVEVFILMQPNVL